MCGLEIIVYNPLIVNVIVLYLMKLLSLLSSAELLIDLYDLCCVLRRVFTVAGVISLSIRFFDNALFYYVRQHVTIVRVKTTNYNKCDIITTIIIKS